MNNSNSGLERYEDVVQLRKDVLTIALIIIALIVAVMWIARNNTINDLKSDIAHKEHERTAVIKHNKNVDKLQQKQLQEMDLGKVKKDLDNFNDLFFKWASWKTYTDNMQELQQLYPKLEEGKTVDVSGKVVGSGKSPESTYESEDMTTTNKGEVSEFVNQNKETPNSRNRTLWYIIANEKDGKFDITHMKRYREFNVY